MSIAPTPIGGASLLGRISNYFIHTLTVLRSTETNVHGDMVQTWAALAEHVDLPCLIAAGDVGARLKRQEVRTSELTTEMTYRLALIPGYHPDIHLADRVTLSLGGTWSVVSVVSDPSSTVTKLFVELLEPSDI